MKTIRGTDGRLLSDEQVELSDVEKIKNTKENEVNTKSDQVRQLQKEVDDMRGEVERIRRRTELKDLLKSYKLMWLSQRLKASEARKVTKKVFV